jgi:hypothetical protein
MSQLYSYELCGHTSRQNIGRYRPQYSLDTPVARTLAGTDRNTAWTHQSPEHWQVPTAIQPGQHCPHKHPSHNQPQLRTALTNTRHTTNRSSALPSQTPVTQSTAAPHCPHKHPSPNEHLPTDRSTTFCATQHFKPAVLTADGYQHCSSGSWLFNNV